MSRLNDDSKRIISSVNLNLKKERIGSIHVLSKDELTSLNRSIEKNPKLFLNMNKKNQNPNKLRDIIP